MASIIIDLSDRQLQQLQELATEHGIPPEALLRASIEDWLSDLKRDFTQAADYVLQKNAELYQRLA